MWGGEKKRCFPNSPFGFETQEKENKNKSPKWRLRCLQTAAWRVWPQERAESLFCFFPVSSLCSSVSLLILLSTLTQCLHPDRKSEKPEPQGVREQVLPVDLRRLFPVCIDRRLLTLQEGAPSTLPGAASQRFSVTVVDVGGTRSQWWGWNEGGGKSGVCVCVCLMEKGGPIQCEGLIWLKKRREFKKIKAIKGK